MMAGLGDIPRLIREFVDMARTYLRQETVEHARKLGRLAGFSLGAGFAFAIGVVLLAVVVMRGLTELLPDGVYYEALAYIIAALILVIFVAILVRLGPRRPSEETRP